MNTLFAATAMAVSYSLIAGGACAGQRPALCKLVVKGKTYIDGECQFSADPDGSFQIASKSYFAQVLVKGNAAEATWNADPKSGHAEAKLGTLTYKGACWVNATTEICARALPPAGLAAALAARPKGERIWPELPGASYTCVMARNGTWADGAPLELVGMCPGDYSANRFVRAGGELRIDRAPGLCVGVLRGSRAATVELQKCDEAGAKWRSSATDAEPATIRSDTGECWTIPALDDKNAMPATVEASRCDDKNANRVKFFFDNN
jgi:hypothetical protein